VQSQTTEEFRTLLAAAPSVVQTKAQNAYRLWSANPAHPSLRFKKVHDTPQRGHAPRGETGTLGGTFIGGAMGRFVIAAFKPKPGKQEQLLVVVAKHWRVLSEQGLVTDRPRYAMRSSDGTILEVFEWRSVQAIESAHQNQAVQALWAEFEAACEYVPLTAVAESRRLFAEFEALPL
jgi:hypothetical protein